MAVPWLLTLVALLGVCAGLSLGQSRTFSSHLAAAGGGLLLGISLFWLLPEVAETAGWLLGVLMAVVACCALGLLDRQLGQPDQAQGFGVVGPLLVGTVIHSFLDGWSVQAIARQRLADVAVPIGLALHKLPEGVALGWITRRTISPFWKAAMASSGAELVTLAGAFVEPKADQSGAAAFGPWWPAGVLAVISGSFLFLGFHAIWPNWKRLGVVLSFLATFFVVGCLGILER